MRLDEIQRIKYAPGKIQTPLFYSDEIKITKDKIDGLVVFYGKSGNFGYGLLEQSQLDSDKIRPVAFVELEEYNDNIWQTNLTEVSRKYQGLGLGLKLYLFLLKKVRYTLISGDQQSPGGKRIWYELWKYSQKDPKLFVYAYFPEEEPDNQFQHVEEDPENDFELIADTNIYADGPSIADKKRSKGLSELDKMQRSLENDVLSNKITKDEYDEDMVELNKERRQLLYNRSHGESYLMAVYK